MKPALIIAASLIACTLAILLYLDAPRRALEAENNATRDLFALAHTDDPRAALAAWLADHPHHPRAATLRAESHLNRNDPAALKQALAQRLQNPAAP